jgi:hypothetical protein
MVRSIGFLPSWGRSIVDVGIRGPGWPDFLLLDRGPAVVKLLFIVAGKTPRKTQGKSMAQVRARWLTFYSEHVEPVSKEIFSHVEKLIIGTLIISAGAHVSSSEPAIVLFGYLRHGLVGRGVMLFGVILLVLNFVDGLYKLARLNWHIAYQILMTILYVALSVRLIQLILAFRGGE